MLKLHFKDARQAPLWLTEERFTLGQDPRNQLQLDDPGISAFHAEIRQEQGYYYLSDCGSLAGTWVNEERVTTGLQLRSGDHIRLASVELQVLDPVKQSTAPRAAAGGWSLQVLKGEREGSKYPVNAALTLGRASDCELCFAGDQQLSRRHCQFYLKEGGLHFKDLGSANGVLLNQQPSKAAPLHAGDQLQLGSMSLLVIGPKITQHSAEEDQDATRFMPMVSAPRAPVQRQSSRGAAVNPARASAADTPPSGAEPVRRGAPWPLLAALLLVVAGAAWMLLGR